MFAASSLNPGHLWLVSAGSTEARFPETVLIKQAVLETSLDHDWLQKYTPLFPLDNDFSLVLALLENEVKLSVGRDSRLSKIYFLSGV